MHPIRNIVILTGAGVSAESGIATFRSPGGLWEGHRVEKKWQSQLPPGVAAIAYLPMFAINRFRPAAHLTNWRRIP